MYGYNLCQLCAWDDQEEDFEHFNIHQLYPELLAHLKCWIVANPGKMITNDGQTVNYRENVEKGIGAPISEEDRDFFLAQCEPLTV